MLQTELEKYLYDHIPLSKAMAVSVLSADLQSIILQAPLAPNINHRETVFGGSSSALAILSAWSLLYLKLMNEGLDARLVIQRNTMEYDKPISGDFTARSSLAQEARWPMFTSMLKRKGRARIHVVSIIEYAGQVAGRLDGEFVALRTVHS